MKGLFRATDEQMMWRVKLQGDAAAFAQLVGRWQKPIYRLCARMTGDMHYAEDLTQIVFQRVFAHRATWEPRAKFSSFLWRVALNLCRDEARKRTHRNECNLDSMENEDGSGWTEASPLTPAAQAEGNERAASVRQALQKLSPPHRDVILLRHYEGLKFHEIADALQLPLGTVKSRMAEALTHLDRLLKHLNEETSCKPKTKIPEIVAC